MAEQFREALALIRRKEVQARSGLSRSALYAAVAAGTFPRPVRIGSSRSVGWPSDEVTRWVETQIRASRKAAA
ncbi:MAG: putative Transcriptional Regulator [Ramlibacter sp.]|jgi:prophage regulatory protein|nr:putative Transcriptional Regulator [Ramlibacter sp.]